MSDLHALQQTFRTEFEQLKAQGLSLDLTRGKPSAQQLDLSDELDGILGKEYFSEGTDTRNYGGLDGVPALKPIFAETLNCPAGNILLGGNSSLTLMYQSLMFANFLGLFPNQKPWSAQGTIKFICPVPGYDRHFKICESFNIEMINVQMNSEGVDMDEVETLVKNDASIKGIWNVPRFSNPTGITYSDACVQRMAELPNVAAADDFIVMWDNAYALHSFDENAAPVVSISKYALTANTYNNVLEFASTSKITFAGSGVAALATGTETLAQFKKHLGVSTIGPDKINQLRHYQFFKNFAGLQTLMHEHAQIIKPRFEAVLNALEAAFDNQDINYGNWTSPQGGYFVSFNAQPGLAKKVVELAGELGVKLTPAGATFPYGKDPQDENIRIAPSFADLEDIGTAMQVFTCCVKLATIEKLIAV